MQASTRNEGLVDTLEIRAALSRVLDSVAFRESPQLRRLLTFLVEEVIAGRGDSLVQYRVATEGLGLAESFDPDKSSLVRSHAGRLRKSLDAYYQGEGGSEGVVITMPASGYRVGFVRIGTNASRMSQKSLHQLPLLVVSRFQGIGLQDRFVHLPASFSEELSVRLGRSIHLRVTLGERTGCGADADFALEGSIEQRGNKLIVRARLLDAPGEVQIWVRRHEFSCDQWDPESFEEEIIDAIAVEVGADFGRIDRHLLRYTTFGSPDEDSLAVALLKAKAFEADFSETAFHDACEALRRVLRDAPREQMAHAALGLIQLVGHCEYFRAAEPFPSDAMEHLAIAGAGNRTNPFVRYGQIVALLLRREYQALSVAAAECLADVDFAPGFATFVGLCQLYSRTATAETRQRLGRLMRQNPDYPRILHTGFALEYLLSGDHQAAGCEMAAAGMHGYWFSPAMDIAIHHAAGRTEEARAARAQLLVRCPDYDRYGEEMLERSLHPDFVRLLMEAYRSAI